jgi:hypothetical protein
MMFPLRTTIKIWADSLIIDYPRDNIPLLTNDKNWREWGNILVQENQFCGNGAPGTNAYQDWLSWAVAVFYVMV